MWNLKRFLYLVIGLVALVFVVTLVWMLAPSSRQTAPPPEPTSSADSSPATQKAKGIPIPSTEEQIQETASDHHYTINVLYPTFHLSSSKEDEDALNADLESLIQKELHAFYSQATYPIPGEETVLSQLSMTYDILHADTKYVVVEFSVNSYSAGSAHPFGYALTFVYDVVAHKQLTLKDVFMQSDEETLNTLSKAAKDSLMESEQQRGTLDTFQKEWITTGTLPTPENFSSFVLTPGNLVLIFPPYQVASYADGPKRVTIPLETLANLKDPGAGVYFRDMF